MTEKLLDNRWDERSSWEECMPEVFEEIESDMPEVFEEIADRLVFEEHCHVDRA